MAALTRRKDPTFYALHCGFPVTEAQATTALGIEVATREHIINVEGGIDLLDVKCIEASGLMAIVIRMRPRVEGQAKTALMAALSGPYLHPKLAIAVDDDIEASDLRQLSGGTKPSRQIPSASSRASSSSSWKGAAGLALVSAHP